MNRSYQKQLFEDRWIWIVLIMVVIVFLVKNQIDIHSLQAELKSGSILDKQLEQKIAIMDSAAYPTLSLLLEKIREIDLGAAKDTTRIRQAQIILKKVNFYDNPHPRTEGRLGDNTAQAIRNFQEYYGLPPTGRLTLDVFIHLIALEHATSLELAKRGRL